MYSPTPDDIVRVARSWIGTPFHHQGRVKRMTGNRGGCDCIGLVVGVARELDIRNIFANDRTDYAKMPDGKELYVALKSNLNEIPVAQIAAGDILLFRFDKAPQHVGIVGDLGGNLSIKHCYLQARGVVEHYIDECWKNRIVAGFRVKY
jgi:NlpC/P60 family putative phage cell wall peptidase